jgi:peptidoglycan/LPS O-acetylase OafA/YrhL
MSHAAASGSHLTGGNLTSLQDGPTASRPTYHFIQALRAVAALMVVAHHATIELHDRNHLNVVNWIPGQTGVDIFFVISGFVMTISSVPLRRTLHPARTFLARRLERIVPLYWIVTTVKIALLLLAPALALNALGTPWHIVASYFFLPATPGSGYFFPIVVVGWTLNFEMAFYVLFAVALASRVSVWKVVAPMLIGITLLRYVPQVPGPLRMYEDSMVLEFLFGVLLAVGLRYVRRIPWPIAALLMLSGFEVLIRWGSANFSPWRGILLGLPAAAMVAAAVALELPFGRRVTRLALYLGDASYSIYLVHTFVLPAIGLLLLGAGNWSHVVLLSVVVMVVLSTAAGVLVYRFVEQPITRYLKGRRQTAIPAVA